MECVSKLINFHVYFNKFNIYVSLSEFNKCAIDFACLEWKRKLFYFQFVSNEHENSSRNTEWTYFHSCFLFLMFANFYKYLTHRFLYCFGMNVCISECEHHLHLNISHLMRVKINTKWKLFVFFLNVHHCNIWRMVVSVTFSVRFISLTIVYQIFTLIDVNFPLGCHRSTLCGVTRNKTYDVWSKVCRIYSFFI